MAKSTNYYRQQCREYGWEPGRDHIIYRANMLLANVAEMEAIVAKITPLVPDLIVKHQQKIVERLQEALGIQSNLRTVVESVWFDDVASGHFDLAIGAVVGEPPSSSSTAR